MRRLLAVAGGVAGSLLLIFGWGRAEGISDAARHKVPYEEIMNQLDPGGDLLLVANLDGILEEAVTQVIQALSVLTPTANQEPLRRIADALPAFLLTNGFYAARGYGLSMAPREDGLHDWKVYVSREPAAASLPLWRGTVGMAQRELRVMELLPADTVMARTSTAELSHLWRIITAGVHELAPPEAAAAFDAGVNRRGGQWGVPLEEVINSLGDESLFSIQFSRTRTIQIPAGTNLVSMPTPSFLIAARVKDDSLSRMLMGLLGSKGLPLTTVDVNGADCTTLNIPLPFPFPVQPTWSMHEGFFLLGSTPDVIAAATEAFEKKSGLLADAEFTRAFAGLPMTNNGLVYVHPRFANVMADVRRDTMAAAAGFTSGADRSVMDLFCKDRLHSVAAVCLNGKHGVLTTGRSSAGGKDVVTGVLLMPVGMTAAIAIPSFFKARDTSRKNACINNLRLLDGAKEQWALANRKKNGDEADTNAVLQYVRGGNMPVCPQGGVYHLNAIGAPPECSIHNHRLP